MGTTDATQAAAGFAVSGDGVCHPTEDGDAAQADTEFSEQADTRFAWAQDPDDVATGLWAGGGEAPADVSSRLSWAVTWGNAASIAAVCGVVAVAVGMGGYVLAQRTTSGTPTPAAATVTTLVPSTVAVTETVTQAPTPTVTITPPPATVAAPRATVTVTPSPTTVVAPTPRVTITPTPLAVPSVDYDQLYIDRIEAQGFTITNRANVISSAHTLCAELRQGVPIPAIEDQIIDTQWRENHVTVTRAQAAPLVTTAMATYPQCGPGNTL
jgi:hypothetical protein